MCILVKNEIAEFCKIIKGTSKQVLWLEMGEEVLGYKIIVGSIYLPNESSKYYSADLFDDVCFDIVSFDSPVCICGDTNSRTGICHDVLDQNDYVAQLYGLQEYEEECINQIILDKNGLIHRQNQDMKVNNAGKLLIETCKANDLCILNGRFGEDKGVGSYTCHNHNAGKSVIDYVVVSYPLVKLVDKFVVHEFDDLLSDTHSAIAVTLNKKKIFIGCHECEYDEDVSNVLDPDDHEYEYDDVSVISDLCDHNECVDLYFKWNVKSTQQYQESFSENDLSELKEQLDIAISTPRQENFDVFCNNINQILIKKAKECGICKEKTNIKARGVKKKKNHKPWFDNECQKVRDSYYRVKNEIKFDNNNVRLDKIPVHPKNLKKSLNEKSRLLQSFTQEN